MSISPRLIFSILGSAVLLSSCGPNADTPQTVGKSGARDVKVPVLVAEVARQPVPITLRAIGNVLPKTTVVLKPQVTGQIAQVHFTEGQDVKEGDLLFTIDPRPWEVALARSNADLEKAKVVATDAEERAKNFASLDTRSVAKDEVNRIQTDAASAKASVLASETAVRSAQLNLDYCTIKAPQSGRTGSALVDPGNVVIANTTDLVVINQVTPIEANFSVAEKFLGVLMEYMNKGELKVIATPEGQKKGAEGTVVFLNNQVNQSAGTISLKGLFPNEERNLWPGQFVNVEVLLTTEPDRVVTPVRAVQTGQDGQFVFIINPDMTASMVPVKLSRTAGDLAVVESGLLGGERVVIDGQGQLRDGAKVDVKPSLDAVLKAEPAKASKPPEPVSAPAATTIQTGNASAS